MKVSKQEVTVLQRVLVTDIRYSDLLEEYYLHWGGNSYEVLEYQWAGHDVETVATVVLLEQNHTAVVVSVEQKSYQ